jgi:hypothetical protein
VKVDEDIYKALLMIPDDVSLVDVQRHKTLSILAAAFEGEIYVVEEYFLPLEKVEGSKTLAHELTHIVQGHYFPQHFPSSYDASKAWTSLIEGDASFTADMYVEYLTLSQGYTVKGDSSSIPPPLVELWLFPYRYGNSFVSYLYSRGGWELVNDAYYHPPNTTEQIIHPEKYVTKEAYINLPSPLSPKGHDIIRTDRLGEHFIQIFLSTHLDTEESEIASAGWNGDNFTYIRVEGEPLFAWRIGWDTSRDQDEFSDAFEKVMTSVDAISLESQNGYKTWRINWRYISLKENDGNMTSIIISTSYSLFPLKEDS